MIEARGCLALLRLHHREAGGVGVADGRCWRSASQLISFLFKEFIRDSFERVQRLAWLVDVEKFSFVLRDDAAALSTPTPEGLGPVRRSAP
jgi:hypothetical protein